MPLTGFTHPKNVVTLKATPMSAQLKPDTAENVGAFYKYLQDAERRDPSKNWVLIVNGAFQGAFASYEAAFRKGVEEFADFAFLIRDSKEEVPVVPFVFTET